MVPGLSFFPVGYGGKPVHGSWPEFLSSWLPWRRLSASQCTVRGLFSLFSVSYRGSYFLRTHSSWPHEFVTEEATVFGCIFSDLQKFVPSFTAEMIVFECIVLPS
jgi:hypothetical protein